MKRVLIVDDDADLLDMVCLLVSSSEMQPVGVSSGNEAISTLEKRRFDLILMDIFLGDRDGREIARTLKSDERFKSVPILLYSAGQIKMSSISESRADAFMQKPFDNSALIEKMQELMRN